MKANCKAAKAKKADWMEKRLQKDDSKYSKVHM